MGRRPASRGGVTRNAGARAGTTAAVEPRGRDDVIERWWPSRYGADDQAGALNEITPTGVASAAGLVRQGRVYDLSHVLDERVPAFPGRSFRQYLTTSAHQLNRRMPGGMEGLGRNGVNWVVEQVTATSQLGTHVDGLNHLQIGDRTYNGHRLDDLVEEYGTNRLGMETMPQIVTRGLLVDAAAVRGVEHLDAGDVVTPDDALAALGRAGLGQLGQRQVLQHDHAVPDVQGLGDDEGLVGVLRRDRPVAPRVAAGHGDP